MPETPVLNYPILREEVINKSYDFSIGSTKNDVPSCLFDSSTIYLSCELHPGAVGVNSVNTYNSLNTDLWLIKLGYTTTNISTTPATIKWSIIKYNDSTIKVENLPKSSSFKIIDLSGRIVKYGIIDHSNTIISIENLSNGYYILNIENESLKFMK